MTTLLRTMDNNNLHRLSYVTGQTCALLPISRLFRLKDFKSIRLVFKPQLNFFLSQVDLCNFKSNFYNFVLIYTLHDELKMLALLHIRLYRIQLK